MKKKVNYLFRLESGVAHQFEVEFDRCPAKGDLPAWTALETDKCPHCPLASAPGARCPAAADLVPVVEQFSALTSIDRVAVTVLTQNCETRKRTDTQTALGALMGLILATSACPILGRMRPMAETHVPFATPTQTVYRILSMHLVGSFLDHQPFDLDGLATYFSDLDRLNHAFFARLERAVERDAGINALLRLHSTNMLANLSIEDEMENIRAWYRLKLPGDTDHAAAASGSDA